MAVIEAGRPVPDFSLEREDFTRFTRSDLEGQTSLLVFYPFVFSPVCNEQLSLYNELAGDFTARGVTLYGISCDASYSQRAFKEHFRLDIEQLSDFEPKGEACRAFGVMHPDGYPERALVLVGPDGVVQWSHQAADPGDLPGANLIFDALDARERV